MSVHEDTMQGLQEALSYAQGNTKLKATVVEASDEKSIFPLSLGCCRKLLKEADELYGRQVGK